jgi:6-phosphogluconate dehydrogenase (decarboxylating)
VAAMAVVEDVPEGLDIIENHTYYQAVLFFNGTLGAAEIMPDADVIISFAVAMNHHFADRQMQAIDMWRDIVSNSAQGFWPAEAELLAASTAP